MNVSRYFKKVIYQIVPLLRAIILDVSQKHGLQAKSAFYFKNMYEYEKEWRFYLMIQHMAPNKVVQSEYHFHDITVYS